MTNYNLSFSKFCGAGNDFILIDDRSLSFPHKNQYLIQNLCHRQNGIGADGIILLQSSAKADFRFRIFNSDASEAEMCGNGMRCFGKFIETLGYKASCFTIETMDRLLVIEKDKENIQVQMGEAKDTCLNIELDLWGYKNRVHFTNTGVPHAVIFVNNIDDIDVKNKGHELRYHPYFAPKGTNANFVQIIDPTKIKIRTYERGVEDETLACGTGATAAALLASLVYNLKSPINVETKSNDQLTISFEKQDNQFKNIKMSGPARLIFQGEISIEGN